MSHKYRHDIKQQEDCCRETAYDIASIIADNMVEQDIDLATIEKVLEASICKGLDSSQVETIFESF